MVPIRLEVLEEDLPWSRAEEGTEVVQLELQDREKQVGYLKSAATRTASSATHRELAYRPRSFVSVSPVSICSHNCRLEVALGALEATLQPVAPSGAPEVLARLLRRACRSSLVVLAVLLQIGSNARRLADEAARTSVAPLTSSRCAPSWNRVRCPSGRGAAQGGLARGALMLARKNSPT